MNKHELVVDSVIVRFGEKQILTDVYLRCFTGQIVGIFGRNGCGKSTLLKVIFGTISAENKSIRIDNKNFENPYLSKNLISYLPQESFLPRNISLNKIIHLFVDDRHMRRRISQNPSVHCNLKKTTRQLSGGELRYFELLLVLSSNSRFVLLDEPFMGIEPLYLEKVKKLITENKSKKGFIITDHNYKDIIEISDKFVSISKGTCKSISQLEELEELNYLPKGTFSQQRKAEIPDSKFLYSTTDNQFEMDSQSYKDLGIFGNYGNGALLSVFGPLTSAGGSEVLLRMLKSPVNDVEILANRKDCFLFFRKNKIQLKHSKLQMEMIEYYLALQAPLLKNHFLKSMISSGTNKSKRRNDNYIITTGIKNILLLLQDLDDLCDLISLKDVPAYVAQSSATVKQYINRPEINEAIEYNTKLGSNIFRKLDRFFRNEGKEQLRKLLGIMYEFEVFAAVGLTAERHKFCFPVYTLSSNSKISIKGLFHPLINNAIQNDFEMANNQNLCVITGANMSGKSTFLKSFGIAVYLSQTGFPVPAAFMETTIFNGLITTINLADSIEKGYSHFYSEVRRVKYTAQAIKDKKKIVVIFDELFRGTNVKEAYDASLLITSAFAKIKSSLFMISTHIVEITEKLKADENIIFKCFESKLEDDKPIYNHKIQNGISVDRMGLRILRNENIIELLNQASDDW